VNTATVQEDNYLKYYITDPWYLGGDRNKADNTAVLTREKCVCIPTTEVCDGKDNDCDTQIDENLGSTSCGLGVCAHTVQNCVNGQPQICNPMQGSSPEICGDGKDNDCDGTVDDGCGPVGCSVANPCCTYSKGGFGGGGTPAQILAANWGTGPFVNGLIIGNANNYDTWSNTKNTPGSGLSTLKLFLHSGGGTSTKITGKFTNPTNAKATGRGGNLATQTAALTVNIQLSGLTGTNMPAGFGDLKYCRSMNSLNGKTVNEILAAANTALGSGQLPAGYSYTSMGNLIDSLNTAFENCKPSSFAKAYLKTSC
jgi:hypothetical protein